MLLLIVVLFRLWFVAPVTFVSPFLLSVPPWGLFVPFYFAFMASVQAGQKRLRGGTLTEGARTEA